ncbi:MAG: DUF5668 domain-containing protein [bacterium]
MTPTSIRRFIWGITVFAAGIVLTLQAYEVLSGSAWKYIWPVFVIIIGFELMFTAIYKPGEEIEIEVPKYWYKKTKRRK